MMHDENQVIKIVKKGVNKFHLNGHFRVIYPGISSKKTPPPMFLDLGSKQDQPGKGVGKCPPQKKTVYVKVSFSNGGMFIYRGDISWE